MGIVTGEGAGGGVVYHVHQSISSWDGWENENDGMRVYYAFNKEKRELLINPTLFAKDDFEGETIADLLEEKLRLEKEITLGLSPRGFPKWPNYVIEGVRVIGYLKEEQRGVEKRQHVCTYS